MDQQGSHHFVLTLRNGRGEFGSWTGTVTPGPGLTRHELFEDLQERLKGMHSQFSQSTVVFFCLEPNGL